MEWRTAVRWIKWSVSGEERDFCGRLGRYGVRGEGSWGSLSVFCSSRLAMWVWISLFLSRCVYKRWEVLELWGFVRCEMLYVFSLGI